MMTFHSMGNGTSGGDYQLRSAMQIDQDGQAIEVAKRVGEHGIVRYFAADGTAGEPLGMFNIIRCDMAAIDDTARPKNGAIIPPAKIDSGIAAGIVKPGQLINVKRFRNLCGGFHPETGNPLLGNSSGKDHRSGMDIHYAPPKAVSVMIAALRLANRGKEAAKLENAIRQAWREGVKYGMQNGAFITRTGKGGVKRETPAELIIAEWPHTSARPTGSAVGDPDFHVHGNVLNVCVRGDGSLGTLDQKPTVRWTHAMGAYSDKWLAGVIQQEMGWKIEPTTAGMKNTKTWTIAGVDEALSARFSKRSKAIEEHARERGAKVATDFDNGATREKKEAIDLTRQNSAWLKDFAALSLTPDQVVYNVAFDAATHGIAAFDPQAREEALAAAIESRLEDQMIIKETDLHRLISEACYADGGQLDMSAELDQLSRLSSDLRLVRLQDPATKNVWYTTARNERLERNFILGVEKMAKQECVTAFNAGEIDKALGKRDWMSQEQAQATRKLLESTSELVLLHGAAGVGKTSTAMSSLADVCRAENRPILAAGPSDQAKDVLSKDLGLDPKEVKTTQGLAFAIRNGKIPWEERQVIICDEGSMIGTTDGHLITGSLRRFNSTLPEYKRARIYLTGDARQLSPVDAGSPFELAYEQLKGGSSVAEIETIVRQNEEWQRQASTRSRDRQGDKAIKAYDEAGKVTWGKNRKDAIKAVVDRLERHMAEHPEKTRIAIAQTRKDVFTLNERLRALHKKHGLVTGEEAMVAVVGPDGRATEIALAKGDRIRFREKLHHIGVQNNDCATVLKVDGHFLTVRMDRTDEIATFDMREMVGKFRDEDSREALLPRMQYAFAVTNHGAQGATVDLTGLYGGDGLDCRAWYVGSTRHKGDLFVAYDCQSIKANLWARKEVGTKVKDITREECQESVYKQVLAPDQKRNVSDFMTEAEKRRWLEAGRRHQTHQARMDQAKENGRAILLKKEVAKAQPLTCSDGSLGTPEILVTKDGTGLLRQIDPLQDGKIVGWEATGKGKGDQRGLGIVGDPRSCDKLVVVPNMRELLQQRVANAEFDDKTCYVSTGGAITNRQREQLATLLEQRNDTTTRPLTVSIANDNAEDKQRVKEAIAKGGGGRVRKVEDKPEKASATAMQAEQQKRLQQQYQGATW